MLEWTLKARLTFRAQPASAPYVTRIYPSIFLCFRMLIPSPVSQYSLAYYSLWLKVPRFPDFIPLYLIF